MAARDTDSPLHKKEKRVAGCSAAEVTRKSEMGSGCESNKETKTRNHCSSFRHSCMPHMNKPLQIQQVTLASMDWPGELRGSETVIE